MKTPNRVPELPKAQEGVSIRCGAERSLDRLDPAVPVGERGHEQVVAVRHATAPSRTPATVEEAVVKRFPSHRVGIGLEGLDLRGVPNELAHLGGRRELAKGMKLYEDVPERRRLDRAREHRSPRDVRGQPAEELVPGAPADHVHDLDRRAGDPLDLLEHEPVLAGEALEHRPDQHVTFAGCNLPALLTDRADARRHVARSHQLGQVRIEERPADRCVHREPGHVGIALGCALRDPGAAAFLDEPEPHHVLQQANAAVEAALVRQVRGSRTHPRRRAGRARHRRATTSRSRCRRHGSRVGTGRRRRPRPCRARRR